MCYKIDSILKGTASSADITTGDGRLRIFNIAGRGGLRRHLSGGHSLGRRHQGHLHGQARLLRDGREEARLLPPLLATQLLHGVRFELHRRRKKEGNQI